MDSTRTNNEQVVMRVASQSNPGKVAGSIAMIIREHKTPILKSVGLHATGVACYALSLAGKFLAADGIFFTVGMEVLDLGESKQLAGCSMTIHPRT